MKLLLCYILASVTSALSFTPCPLLGPAFPPYTLDTDDKILNKALETLTHKFNTQLGGNSGSHGETSPNTTFSVALFSANPGTAAEEPFFWEYHYAAPWLNKSTSGGARVVDKDSVYRIGGLTEVFTVWSLLLGDGGLILDEPVTEYLPELNRAAGDDIERVAWDEVTVGQLASHMSGLARDYCSRDVAAPGLPKLSSINTCCSNPDKCDSNNFIQLISEKPPVAPAGVTPSYSNMAFQLLGYIIERRAGKPFTDVLTNDIFTALNMTKTSIFAPANNSVSPVIPISREASGWSSRLGGEEASKSIYSSTKDLAIAGQAILNSTLLDKSQTNRWLKPVAHTSNPANSLGMPFTIYLGGNYPDQSLVDVYTVLSNEGYNESLYSSYIGLVPDYGVGYAILSADTEGPADLNAHADIIGDVVLTALVKMAVLQAGESFNGTYTAAADSTSLSSITVRQDNLMGLYIDEFISNGTDFRETLSGLVGVEQSKDLSIRLYPTQRVGSKQAFRAVLQDVTELADNDTPTCVSWMDVDELQYGGRGLDEFVFEVDERGRAVGVEIPALRVVLSRVYSDRLR
ncbi:hypothetical protein ASPVEDRAFT_79301 [Aspergillus versicolor CBS 583.65]|uniref:Beta-lactamase-related domain-containing protein n=1 Tax=Aspergillus versicolor CBS 583.65 TaxID=1036611 RepID=A0A1L9P7W2_ASPVE|nr:uncharacterized protein ASPVEDRAFT_79301 [Aspergillus versicolor CBS 583.65]OJI97598.1 hypothetical protein ASPVEDRAFT_79301 [Aspergillus versicolor CBS 583.65]